MSTRQRRNDSNDDAGGEDSGHDPSQSGKLNDFRSEGRELLDAGAAHIDKALSRDSQSFLNSIRQLGGQ